MSENVRITVLVENSVHRRGLVAEHGLCLHVQIGERALLFDTGQTDLALINAETLRIPLDRLDGIVLSHGHYDHTGGLPAILEAAPKAPVYLHPAALEEKYSQRSDGRSQFIGMNPKTVQGFRDRRNHIETIGCTQTMEGVFVTGEIPRLNAYEDTGGPFFQNAACMQPDLLPDDQALVIDLGSSVIVLLGCAHSGVVNTLDHIDTLTHGKPVSAVIGGLHLSSANEVRMEKTMDRLRAANLQCLAPAHCTGWSATDRLRRAFPKIIRSAEVGTMLDFKRA